MKHNLKVTALLLVFFLLAQYLGLAILYQYIDPVRSLETGQTEFKDLPIGERPPAQEQTSYLPVILAILIGTAIFFVLIKYKLIWIWKNSIPGYLKYNFEQATARHLSMNFCKLLLLIRNC